MKPEKTRPYSKKQWFWAVNFIALLGALGILLPPGFSAPIQVITMFPVALVAALIIAWLFFAYPLSIAMRIQATWLRAGLWGGGTATMIALVWFGLDHWSRYRARENPNFDYRIGGGDYVRDIDGVLTSYGWWVLWKQNLYFVVMGVCIALIVHAVFGPGRNSNENP